MYGFKFATFTIIYHKKSTLHVGKYTVRPMDPSWVSKDPVIKQAGFPIGKEGTPGSFWAVALFVTSPDLAQFGSPWTSLGGLRTLKVSVGIRGDSGGY